MSISGARRVMRAKSGDVEVAFTVLRSNPQGRGGGRTAKVASVRVRLRSGDGVTTCEPSNRGEFVQVLRDLSELCGHRLSFADDAGDDEPAVCTRKHLGDEIEVLPCSRTHVDELTDEEVDELCEERAICGPGRSMPVPECERPHLDEVDVDELIQAKRRELREEFERLKVQLQRLDAVAGTDTVELSGVPEGATVYAGGNGKEPVKIVPDGFDGDATDLEHDNAVLQALRGSTASRRAKSIAEETGVPLDNVVLSLQSLSERDLVVQGSRGYWRAA